MKHGDPASSELGFQVRERQGTITVSTGDLDDTTTQEASDMVGAYATFQLARSAQILSVHGPICRLRRHDKARGSFELAEDRPLRTYLRSMDCLFCGGP